MGLLLYWLVIGALSRLCTAEKPVLSNKNKDLIKALGQEVIMSCSFESNGPMNITWLKDGQPITYDSRIFVSVITLTMSTLNIKILQIGDDGTYRCVGANKDGQTVGDIKLELIEVKPKILPIEDVYLTPGQSITIQCSADAVPAAAYTWQRVRDLKDDNVDYLSGGRLRITSAKDENSGTYRCEAENSIDKDTLDVKVVVGTDTRWLVTPDRFIIVSASQKTYALTASFVTPGDQGAILKSLKWFKDSILMSTSGGGRTIETNVVGARYTSRVFFNQLNTGDSGVYKVIANLKSVSEFSYTTNMTVRSRPMMEIDEGKDFFTEEGLEATFTCIANAFPAARLQWKKNDTVLLSSDDAADNVKLEGTRTTFILKLSNVDKGNSGVYTCSGTNSEGTGEANIDLSVRTARVLGDSSDDEKIIIGVVIASVILIIIIIVAAFLYIRYRDRWCPNKYSQANGTFYTDLVQEEKDASCLEDIENNPYAMKKNINISMKRGDRSGTIGTKPTNQSIKGRSLSQSIRQGMSIKRPGSGNTLENHYGRLDTLVCQGKAIDFKHIVFDECLGSGEYGLVNGGRIIEDENATVFKEVTIKMLKDDFRAQDRRDMLTELRMMRRVPKHKNIVTLIGWCIADDNVYVVEEFVPFGSLLTCLRAQRCLNKDKEALEQLPVEDRLDEKTLLSFASQIAGGMKHLEELQIIHRDLACRNVYLGFEKTCKIADYGLVRDIYAENVYRKTTGGQLPVRWMAREAIFEGQYTHQSDVWSFGILLWELVTLGKIPYSGIMRTEHLLEEIDSGYHMENPGHISTDLYLLISSCWNREPSKRPRFKILEKNLNGILEDTDEVHIDLPKLFHNETEEDIGAEELVKSPTGDFHRPNPFNSLKEQPVEEEEEENSPNVEKV